MSRLTELIDVDGMKIKTAKERPLSNQGLGAILHKLYKLEDLEDELGCPLENIMPLLLAYKQRYIYTKNGKEEIVSQVGLTTDDEWCVVTRKGFILAKDYQKTWWLRKNGED